MALATVADEQQQQLPLVGFRFVPTDFELVDFFLRNKIEGVPISPYTPILDDDRQIFGGKELPWDVFEQDHPYWNYHYHGTQAIKITKTIYAFTKLVPVSGNTTTPATGSKNRCHRRHVKRTAGSGTWSGKAKNTPIKINGGIGNKTSFCFKINDESKFEGKGKWMLHEFSLELPDDQQTNWVLCKITVEIDNYPEIDAVVDDHEVEDITRKRKFTSNHI